VKEEDAAEGEDAGKCGGVDPAPASSPLLGLGAPVVVLYSDGVGDLLYVCEWPALVRSPDLFETVRGLGRPLFSGAGRGTQTKWAPSRMRSPLLSWNLSTPSVCDPSDLSVSVIVRPSRSTTEKMEVLVFLESASCTDRHLSRPVFRIGSRRPPSSR